MGGPRAAQEASSHQDWSRAHEPCNNSEMLSGSKPYCSIITRTLLRERRRTRGIRCHIGTHRRPLLRPTPRAQAAAPRPSIPHNPPPIIYTYNSACKRQPYKVRPTCEENHFSTRETYCFILTVPSTYQYLILSCPPLVQVRLYIELKSLEIRTEVWQEPAEILGEEGGRDEDGLNPLEARWNHEPLDHTRSRGRDRLENGCPYSRQDGVAFNVST